jgi:hypothetical protein
MPPWGHGHGASLYVAPSRARPEPCIPTRESNEREQHGFRSEFRHGNLPARRGDAKRRAREPCTLCVAPRHLRNGDVTPCAGVPCPRRHPAVRRGSSTTYLTHEGATNQSTLARLPVPVFPGARYESAGTFFK